jgi:superfamily I DNA and/or RNA helicase
MSEVLDLLEDKTTQILITSHTNVAGKHSNLVDCVLLSLFDKGYTNFGRIGCLKKINKIILPYSLIHKKAEDNDKEEIKELEAMLEELNTALSKGSSHKENKRLNAEKESIEETLKQIHSSSSISRKEKVLSKRVIGVTIASCYSQYLANSTFAYIFLDECSQMLEPQSFIPIYKFAAKKIVIRIIRLP